MGSGGGHHVLETPRGSGDEAENWRGRLEDLAQVFGVILGAAVSNVSFMLLA